MSSHIRFAIYYLPPEGALAQFGARWLGWDCLTGETAPQPDLPEIAKATDAPRKYGFHATLKPPFRLATDTPPDALRTALAQLTANQPPVVLDGLTLDRLGNFLALRPVGDTTALNTLAGQCVTGLDRFRAPPEPAELARRRKSGLSPRQDELLREWGYPYVLEEFRFHMTLSGSLDEDGLARFRDEIIRRLPALPRPYVIDSIALVGQRADGMFQLIQRYALTG